MRPRGTPQNLEKRRLLAMQLLRSGKTFRRVAEEVGASLSSVVRWNQKYLQAGRKALTPKIIRGRSPFLSARQRKKLVKILLRGPLEIGYQTNLWTLKLVGDVIENQFGIRYSIANLWKLMYLLGWNFQKPERRARTRSPQAVPGLENSEWPSARKAQKVWIPTQSLWREISQREK